MRSAGRRPGRFAVAVAALLSTVSLGAPAFAQEPAEARPATDFGVQACLSGSGA